MHLQNKSPSPTAQIKAANGEKIDKPSPSDHKQTDGPKTDEPKTDGAKMEEPKTAGPKLDGPKTIESLSKLKDTTKKSNGKSPKIKKSK